MELKFIEKGTPLFLKASTRDKTVGNEYSVEFNDIVGITSFSVKHNIPLDTLSNLDSDMFLVVTFFRASALYSFKGRISKTIFKDGSFITQIDQMSSIDTTNRRAWPRHNITTPVIIREPLPGTRYDEPKNTGKLLYSAQTIDISAGGLCIFSNNDLILQIEQVYMLEFTLNRVDEFIFAAQLVRFGNCPQSVQFKYDYGFSFILPNEAEDRSKLGTALFNHKMKGL